MGGYIGARAGSLSTTTVANVQDVTATDTTPEVTIINNTHEDTDGGREGKVIFKGQQSGGEESTLAEIQGSHDGTSDDQKGDLIFKTNDGSDNASPTEVMRLDSSGDLLLGTTTSPSSADVKQVISASSGAFSQFSVNGGAGSAIGSPAASQMALYTTTGNVGSETYTERMRIDDSGNVGIGESLPVNKMSFGNVGGLEDDANTLYIGANFTSTGGNYRKNNFATQVMHNSADGTIRFRNAASGTAGNSITFSERMRLTSDGDLLIGNTSTGLTSDGINLHSDGTLEVRRNISSANSSTVGYISRGTTDGNILQFYKDTTHVGSIGSVGGANMRVGSGDVGVRFDDGSDVITPWNTSTNASRDNAIDLGHGTARFDDIYATNGTIQTSDETEKKNIASLTSAEITAATAISKLFKTYKWKDKVAAKGNDARTHTGVVAQQVETAMSNAGLDASKYAFWCSDTWWEKDVEVAAVTAVEAKDAVYDDDGKLVSEAVEAVEAKDAYTRNDQYYTKDEAPSDATERTRLGVRYPELLAFIGAATEQRLTSIESRLTALEG